MYVSNVNASPAANCYICNQCLNTVSSLVKTAFAPMVTSDGILPQKDVPTLAAEWMYGCTKIYPKRLCEDASDVMVWENTGNLAKRAGGLCYFLEQVSGPDIGTFCIGTDELPSILRQIGEYSLSAAD